MERMEANPRLGTTSGKPYFIDPRTGTLVPEVCGDEMSVGHDEVLPAPRASARSAASCGR